MSDTDEPKLSLSNNKIGEPWFGAQAIADALKVNPSLKTLMSD